MQQRPGKNRSPVFGSSYIYPTDRQELYGKMHLTNLILTTQLGVGGFPSRSDCPNGSTMHTLMIHVHRRDIQRYAITSLHLKEKKRDIVA